MKLNKPVNINLLIPRLEKLILDALKKKNKKSLYKKKHNVFIKN